MEKQKLEIIKYVAGLINEDDVEALSYYIIGEPLEFLIRTYNRKTLKNISEELIIYLKDDTAKSKCLNISACAKRTK